MQAPSSDTLLTILTGDGTPTGNELSTAATAVLGTAVPRQQPAFRPAVDRPRAAAAFQEFCQLEKP